MEQPGYAVYSYILLRGKPDNQNSERYVAALTAFRDEIPTIERLHAEGIPAAQLNITYVPFDPQKASESDGMDKWLLAYNYDAARKLLRAASGATKDGPYIISYDRPLSRIGQELGRDEILFQDLSWVPPDVIKLWVKEFMRQASQPGAFAKEDPFRQFLLTLRSGIDVAAKGVPEIEKAWGEVKERWDKAVGVEKVK
jgi:hypothetical protein